MNELQNTLSELPPNLFVVKNKKAYIPGSRTFRRRTFRRGTFRRATFRCKNTSP